LCDFGDFGAREYSRGDGGIVMSFAKSLREKALDVWEAGYNHPFVQEIGAGTLDKESFKFYLLQDYLYLIQYAKVFALGALKSDTIETMRKFSTSQYFTINGELGLHEEYMEKFGITPEEVQNVRPSLFNSAYTANMLAQGQTGGLAELIATVFPCAWTYAEYGQRLKADNADKLEDNYYKSWIEMYASEEFEESFQWFYETLDRLVENMSLEQKARIEQIFIQSVEFEYLFWDMSYKKQMSF
jgi:thiaminase/transcriptional activator TenA